MLLSALLTFLMYPTVIVGKHFPDLGIFAWIHLVPVVVVLYQDSFRKKLICFTATFFLAYCGVIYWLTIAVTNFGGVNFFITLIGFFLFNLVFAFLTALPLAIAVWIARFNQIRLFLLLPLFLTCRDALIEVFPIEGFPWYTVAYTQGHWLDFFQWVDVTGVFGVSFLIYLMNGLIADGLIQFFYRKKLDKLVSRFLVVFVLILFSLFFSFLSSRAFEKTKINKGHIRVALVQGNISQEMKWDPYLAQNNLYQYLRLSSLAAKNGAELILWPETAYPYGLYESHFVTEKFLDQDQLTTPLMIGAVVYRKTFEKDLAYNATLFIDKDANITASYYKKHLVPFGEYLPYAPVLKYLGPLVSEVGQFDRGESDTLFDFGGIQFGSLICFEDVFLENPRAYAKKGAHVLVNFTNDSWYEDTSAQYQHLVFSQFRALENRRPLLRVTNTGYTAVVSPRGQVLDSLRPFQEGYLLYNLSVEVKDTFFTKRGHLWLFFVLGITGLIFLYALFKWTMGPVRYID